MHQTQGRRFRVVFVQPNSEIGGSDIALARTIEYLVPHGVEASVVLPNDGPLAPRLRAAGASLHIVPMRQLRTLPSVSYQARYALGIASAVRAIGGVIRVRAPDLVHTNSLYCIYGALAAKLHRTPHLWHVREIPPRIALLTSFYASIVDHLSWRIVAMTDACAEGLFGNRSPSSCRVIPDALDANDFAAKTDPYRVRNELGIARDAPVVGFAARLDPWKGAEVFIEACARVARQRPEAVFVVAGGAPDGFEEHARMLHNKAKALGVAERVHFTGWRYGPSDMADVMATFDLFCHASVRPEPFGLVLLEAMAVGTPVIAAAAGGPLTILRDGESGLLVAPGSPDLLAAAVVSLLDDPARRRALASAASARLATTFSPEAFVQQMLSLYGEAVQPLTNNR